VPINRLVYCLSQLLQEVTSPNFSGFVYLPLHITRSVLSHSFDQGRSSTPPKEKNSNSAQQAQQRVSLAQQLRVGQSTLSKRVYLIGRLEDILQRGIANSHLISPYICLDPRCREDVRPLWQYRSQVSGV
jgi:hypothetical protein